MPTVSIDFGAAGCLKQSQKDSKQNNLSGVMKHNARLYVMASDELGILGIAPENIDITRSHLNRYYINERWKNNSQLPDIDKALKELVTKPAKTRRHDAVLVRSFCVQVSPDWCFSKIRDEKWDQNKISHSTFEQRGPLEKEKCYKLFDTTLDFFKNKFGDKLLSAQLHLDETGPHIHIQVVPVTADGRLANKELLNGESECVKFVDEFADSCKSLGLKRPELGGKQSLSDEEWEAEKKRHRDLINAQNQNMPDRPTVTTVKEVQESEAPAIVRRINGAERAAYDAQCQVVALNDKLQEVTAQRDEINRKYQENAARYAEERERLKTLDVETVFQDLYGHLATKDTGERSQYFFSTDSNRRNKKDCDLKLKFTNDLFIDNKNRKISGKGVFNLVMKIENCDFQTAVQILKRQYPEKTIAVHIATETDKIERNVKNLPHLTNDVKTLALSLPEPVSDNESSLYRFANERKISRNVIDFLLQSSQMYADEHKNFVFPRFTGGAVLHGSVQPRPGKKSYHKTIGGKACGPVILRGPYYDNSKPCRLCEGVSDAMACLSKWPQNAVCVVGGDLNPDMPEMLPGQGQILCFDRDQHGDELTTKYLEIYPGALDERPEVEGQDWSEAWQDEVEEKERLMELEVIEAELEDEEDEEAPDESWNPAPEGK